MPITYEELERMIQADQPPLFPPFCLACGYDLRGSPSGRCPECGRVFVRGEWKKELIRIKHAAGELRDANDWAQRAVVIAIAGLVMAALRVPLRGTCLGQLLGAVGALSGAIAALLGSAVFRTDRLPAWASEYGPAPHRDQAIGCIALGAVAIAAVVIF